MVLGLYIKACTSTNKAIMLMRDMPVDKSLFGGFLQSAVSKAATALLNYNALQQQLITAAFTKPHQLWLQAEDNSPFRVVANRIGVEAAVRVPQRDNSIQQLKVQ